MMQTKKEVWRKIKDREINFLLKNQLYSIIENYFERVEFVKDHVGVRDFLFLAEDGLSYTSDFFIAINVECEKSYSYSENLELFLKEYNDESIKALNGLENFFEKTNRTLYIGIGFKESEEINKEEFSSAFLSGKYSSQEEILKIVRKFPEWYKDYAKYPEEIRFITVKAEKYITDVLRPMERLALKNQMNEILEKNDLSNSDKDLLKTLAGHLTY